MGTELSKEGIGLRQLDVACSPSGKGNGKRTMFCFRIGMGQATGNADERSNKLRSSTAAPRIAARIAGPFPAE